VSGTDGSPALAASYRTDLLRRAGGGLLGGRRGGYL